MVRILNYIILLSIVAVIVIASGCSSNTPNNTQASTTTTPETPATPVETNVTVNSSEMPSVSAGGKIIEVTIQNFAFNPSSITISPGDSVKWVNMDSVAHTIVGTDFSSSNLNNGGSFEHTFAKPGTYSYRCSIHPSMQGTIIVE